jgi:flagellin-like protein
MNYNMRKFRKNAKALSPVVASIILIAVTVAVSVVVAAWMGGMTTGLMGNAEQGTITNIAFSDPNQETLIVTVQNTGNSQITIKDAYVNTAIAPTPSASPQPTGIAVIPKGQSATIVLDFEWDFSTDYTVKLTTSKGNNLVLTATSPSA